MPPIVHDVELWVLENEKNFVPPVCLKLMYTSGQLKTFFVGGPNARDDFHIEAGEEFFYQVKGCMNLLVVERNKFRDIPIKEGEVFLLPARIPHSPRRSHSSLGMVIERERAPEEMDCVRYYVKESDQILYEKWFHCDSLEALTPILLAFRESDQCRTGRPVPGAVSEVRPLQQDNERVLEAPFSLSEWLNEKKAHLSSPSSALPLFTQRYESRIHILGCGKHNCHDDFPETFLLQLEGDCLVFFDKEKRILRKNQTMLIPAGEKYCVDADERSRLLSLIMNPL